MNNKTLFVYNSLSLFKVLNEIKENFYFKLEYIDSKNYKKINFDDYKNYLIISSNSKNVIENCIIINNLPEKIDKLAEAINLGFLKQQFNKQSKYKIGKYDIDLNSKKIRFNNKSFKLTEKESNLILYINSSKKVGVKQIQKIVWGYSNDLETHTVETHIYRLRKKMIENFNDHSFIKHDENGYFLNV